jgi:hypothetical protein
MNKKIIIDILKDFIDYADHFPIDEEIYDQYSEKIFNLLDEPCGIFVKEATKNIGLNIIYQGQREKFLSKPLTDRDKIFLEILDKFWAKAWFIRPQIKRFKTTERVRLMDAPELHNTWERRVYYWYLGQPEGIKDERGQFHNFRTLPIKTVIIALYSYYPKLFSQEETEYLEKWKCTKNLTLFVPIKVSDGRWSRKKRLMPIRLLHKKERILKIRKIAQRDLSRYTKQGLSRQDILEKRGITITDLEKFKKTYKNFTFNAKTGLPDNQFEPNDIPRG